MTRSRPSGSWQHSPYLKPVLISVGLVALFILTRWFIQVFHDPNQMGVIESQAMDMTVKPPEGAMPVEIEVIKPEPFAAAVTYTGNVVAYNDVPVYPRVEGRIVAMNVYPGDRVRVGKPLVQLDTDELTARVNEARFGNQAALQQAEAAQRLTQKEVAGIERAHKEVQAAKADYEYWQVEVGRARSLVQEDVITREEAEREESQFETAQANYQQALAKLKAAREATNAATLQAKAQQANAKAAAATLQTRRIVKDYTTITAPFDGVITRRMISPGTLVQPGMPILQLAQIHPIRVQAQVAESDWASIHVGDPVLIQSVKQGSIHSKVSAVFPAADWRTHTAIIEAIVPNTDERLIPGDFATVSIETGTRANKLTVPNTALIHQNDQIALWVLRDGKAHLQYVTTGATNGKRTAVVKGLAAGETIITKGIENLQNDQPVIAAEYGPDGLKVLPGPSRSNRLAATNNYQLSQSFKQKKLQATLSPNPPHIGNNELLLTLTSTQGNMPDDLSLEATYHMPSMPKMAVVAPKVEKMGPGRFKVTSLLFSMPGLWQVKLSFKQNGRQWMETKLETEVPQ